MASGCSDDDECESKAIFKYNESNGKCLNCEGKEGYNVVDFEKVRISKNAECMDLSGINLINLLDTTNNQNSDHLMDGYNFKGSNFNKSVLNFAYIMNGNFDGADLSNLDYYYATIDGKIDNFTKLPVIEGCKIVNSDSISCGR